MRKAIHRDGRNFFNRILEGTSNRPYATRKLYAEAVRNPKAGGVSSSASVEHPGTHCGWVNGWDGREAWFNAYHH